jgi:hypothetical protein
MSHIIMKLLNSKQNMFVVMLAPTNNKIVF